MRHPSERNSSESKRRERWNQSSRSRSRNGSSNSDQHQTDSSSESTARHERKRSASRTEIRQRRSISSDPRNLNGSYHNNPQHRRRRSTTPPQQKQRRQIPKQYARAEQRRSHEHQRQKQRSHSPAKRFKSSRRLSTNVNAKDKVPYFIDQTRELDRIRSKQKQQAEAKLEKPKTSGIELKAKREAHNFRTPSPTLHLMLERKYERAYQKQHSPRREVEQRYYADKRQSSIEHELHAGHSKRRRVSYSRSHSRSLTPNFHARHYSRSPPRKEIRLKRSRSSSRSRHHHSSPRRSPVPQFIPVPVPVPAENFAMYNASLYPHLYNRHHPHHVFPPQLLSRFPPRLHPPRAMRLPSSHDLRSIPPRPRYMRYPPMRPPPPRHLLAPRPPYGWY